MTPVNRIAEHFKRLVEKPDVQPIFTPGFSFLLGVLVGMVVGLAIIDTGRLRDHRPRHLSS